MLQNRKFQIIAGIIAVIVLLLGGYFLIAGKSNEAETEPTVSSNTIQKISAEELGLKISANASKNEVKFSISKLKDIKSIEYEVQYEADSTAQEQSEGGEPRVQRGITGEAELKPGDTEFESDWIVLGSESAGTKRYDKGVQEVGLTLKIDKKDGKTYQAEESLEL